MKRWGMIILFALTGCYTHSVRFGDTDTYDRVEYARFTEEAPADTVPVVESGIRRVVLDNVRMTVDLAGILKDAGFREKFTDAQLDALHPTHNVEIAGYVDDAKTAIIPSSISYNVENAESVLDFQLDAITNLRISYTIHFLTPSLHRTRDVVECDSGIDYDIHVRHTPCLRLQAHYMPFPPPTHQNLCLTPELPSIKTVTHCSAGLVANR